MNFILAMPWIEGKDGNSRCQPSIELGKDGSCRPRQSVLYEEALNTVPSLKSMLLNLVGLSGSAARSQDRRFRA